MKFFAIAALFAGALAMPTTEIEARTDKAVCPSGLYSNLVCADVDVLGILCLHATSPSETPRDARHFQEICAKVGKQARCAVLPVAEQAVLCQRPAGVSA
ncbi:Cell wall protein qid3 [Beauveria bassiana]|uniref:Class II hydrophobin B n=1 Tax=Beauveria bassiana (strain ARSEF 2860) TaxID=655819 RepID=HYD2B_BEAB2|nr:hydrophobin-like protein [Beauveria bassiana ARSEF 2860]EJP68103.1 hydrophobin-like protein [Beauveria bassiana ARSEF 2860]KAF1729749.1 Cell wall protein qid3 [Beauveria bassiana]KAH8713757.1 Cell wall protein qid3 [Beauveria bassiana]